MHLHRSAKPEHMDVEQAGLIPCESLADVAAAVDADNEWQQQEEDVDSTAGNAREPSDNGRDASEAGRSGISLAETMRRTGKSFSSAVTERGVENPLSRENLHKAFARLKKNLPGWLRRRLTFYRIHFAVFFLLMLIGTMIMYFSPNGSGGPLAFIDCMYVATSALCVVGLISVRMDQLSTFDKVVLLFLMLIGSQVFTSLVPVFVRMYYFKKYLKREGMIHSEGDEVVEPVPQQQQQNGGSNSNSSTPADHLPKMTSSIAEGADGPIRRDRAEPDPDVQNARHTPLAEHTPRNQRHSESTARPRSQRFEVFHDLPQDFLSTPGASHGASQTWAGETAEAQAKKLRAILEASNKPSGTPFTRTGTLPPLPRSLTSAITTRQEHHPGVDDAALAPAERRLIELLALQMLSWLVPIYFFGFLISCSIILLICLVANEHYLNLLSQNDINVVFMAAFQAVAAFANGGLSLLDSNMVEFQAYFPYLLFVAVLILAGNTCYAPTLRLLLIMIRRFGTEKQRFVAAYLLEHPRRCYTHLFPPSDTRWLVFTVVLFNLTQFVFFFLDWDSPAFQGLPPQVKVLDAAFQSISTRSPGYNVIALSGLSPAMLVLIAGLMYVAVYPVYLTRQQSRVQREVYDDEDLRIFYEDLQEGVLEKGILAHSKAMFFRDSALLFLSVFVVCLIEKEQILGDPTNFSIFSIVFENISAYGNVGLTLGFTCPPGAEDCDPVPYSFSGVWNPWAKFVIILVMFLGRHRGLPDNIDAAIVIPDEKQFRRSLSGHITEEKAPILMRMQSVVTPHRTSSTLVRRSTSVAPDSAQPYNDSI